jgi:putative tricarboxylic transport membrane protein
VGSFVGGVLSTIGLLIFAPLLAKFALYFGPAEYFVLFVLAFTTIGGISSKNQFKSLMAAAMGLMISTIGLDPATGEPRYTLNQMELFEGVNFLVAIVGLFAISEVLFFLEDTSVGSTTKITVNKYKLKWKEMFGLTGTMLRSSFVGFLAGVLPGAGASLGSFLGYTIEKRMVDRNGTFGTGDPRGVAAPEAANNAAAGGALVPMLTLGVPGSGTTAVLLAMLMSMNITPGPLLFVKNPEIVWGLIAALFIGNAMLLVLNLPLVGYFARLLMIPSYILMPIVTIVSLIGIYSISHSAFDLFIMIAFGVGGWLLRKLEVPLVPIILGIILGQMMEDNLRRALTISNGDWTVLWGSPLCIGLWIMATVGLVLPYFVGSFFRVKIMEPEPEITD